MSAWYYFLLTYRCTIVYTSLIMNLLVNWLGTRVITMSIISLNSFDIRSKFSFTLIMILMTLRPFATTSASIVCYRIYITARKVSKRLKNYT